MTKDANNWAKGLAGNQEKSEATIPLRTFWARRHMNPRKLARKPPYEVRRRLMGAKRRGHSSRGAIGRLGATSSGLLIISVARKGLVGRRVLIFNDGEDRVDVEQGILNLCVGVSGSQLHLDSMMILTRSEMGIRIRA